MSATRIGTVAVVLLALATSARAQDQPQKRWVWLTRQGVWGYGYQIQEGPYRGLWRIDPGSKVSPSDLLPAVDPYGFTSILNWYRASAGLAPLAYDYDLSLWAAQNNAEQASRGIGHHVIPNCCQNCAWNTPDAHSVAQAWMKSRGHRANMLDPSITHVGIAFGPGPYWTMNAK
jgi:Cysteine-rich secretory protein family